jgi:hypothetical protein
MQMPGRNSAFIIGGNYFVRRLVGNLMTDNSYFGQRQLNSKNVRILPDNLRPPRTNVAKG